MICVGLFVMWCQVAQPQVVDSFCEVYQQIVVAKGDGSIAASPGVKRRVLANELTYRKLCRGK